MDKIIRNTQLELLKIFSKSSKTFALAGGTALELFYLKHRFSMDLDFFSPRYSVKEIEGIVLKFNKSLDRPLKLEDELFTRDRARVRFYTAKVKGTRLPLKLDFVEDVYFESPAIKKFKGIHVYSIEDIYTQKIMTLVGSNLRQDITGREIITGRKEARDIVDVYYLSEKICPLHKFIKNFSDIYKRGIVYWYRTYSREELKFGVLDLDIYDKNFNIANLIKHFDEEVKKIISKSLGEAR